MTVLVSTRISFTTVVMCIEMENGPLQVCLICKTKSILNLLGVVLVVIFSMIPVAIHFVVKLVKWTHSQINSQIIK